MHIKDPFSRLRVDANETCDIGSSYPQVHSWKGREGWGSPEIIRSTSTECLETLLLCMKEVDSSRIVEGRDW